MIDLLVALLFLALGAAWRVWHGSDSNREGEPIRIRGGYRRLMGVSIAVAAAGYGLGGQPPALWLGGLAGVTLVAGYTDWESWWMVPRYGLGTVLAAWPVAFWSFATGAPLDLVFAILAWGTFAGPLAGLAYVALLRKWLRPPDLGPLIGAEAWARAVAGALVVGGPAAIPAIALAF